MRQLRTGLLTLAVCLATLAGTASAATAGSTLPPKSFRVTTQPLVLTAQPGGGYFGVFTFTVTYTGKQANAGYAGIHLVPPANFDPGPFNGFGACIINNGYRCSSNNTFARGVPQTLSVGFTGFAAPADFARLATGGFVRLSSNDPAGRPTTAQISGVMAATDGSTGNPRPYTPALAPDMGFIASNIVAADGVLSIDITVRNHNDAYNFGAWVVTVVQGLPLSFISVSPPVMCLFPGCSMPGDTLYEGSERSLQLNWGYSGAPGTYTGAITLDPSNATSDGNPDDINPADNTLPITITIP
jgi:hypothetical protein